MTDAVRLTRDTRDVATLTLHRPDKRNAVSVAMWEAIPPLLAPLAVDASLRVLIVKGAGEHFSGGADIAEFDTVYATHAMAMENHRIIQAAMQALEDFPSPTLALIDGACFGGGCGLALACDWRIATHRARFAITPAKLGLVYGVSDTRRLVQAVGVAHAKDILFTGRVLSAAEAHRIGLAQRLDDDLRAAGEAYAEALRQSSNHTARSAKQILRMLDSGARDDTDESRALFANAFAGDDFKEGASAFLQKRPPRFG